VVAAVVAAVAVAAVAAAVEHVSLRRVDGSGGLRREEGRVKRRGIAGII
jgi:hypothetical protein